MRIRNGWVALNSKRGRSERKFRKWFGQKSADEASRRRVFVSQLGAASGAKEIGLGLLCMLLPLGCSLAAWRLGGLEAPPAPKKRCSWCARLPSLIISAHVIFTPCSLHHFMMIRTMYSTWGLDVFRTMVSTSCKSSRDALPAIISWNTPTHAPRLPSQYSGSGSRRSRTSKALAAYLKCPMR